MEFICQGGGDYVYQIKGNVLWQYMEGFQLIEGRSWQAMKERFMKRVHKDNLCLDDIVNKVFCLC